MKKILLIALGACMIAGTTKAQSMKQAGNENNLQVLFAPLGGNPISISGISFRKFNATGDAAWRVNLFIGLNNKTSVNTQPIDTGSYATGGGRPEGDVKTSSFTFGIRPGYEKHFAGTERFSPYIGAELLFSMTTASTDSDFVVSNADVNHPAGTAWNVLTANTKGSGASTTFGLNLIAGADYYFAKNLSLGVELGFGFSTTSMPDITGQTLGNNKTTGAFELQDVSTQKQGSSMQLGPNAVGQLKLGWLF